ncbi:EF-hand domain-containing protein [Pseudomonas sp. A-RE-19]|uniref:EF-hand domain-containing protein n=1 Tax=Pseudomonas sp. A-RE-19 TaxID=2832401 RepID=UPI001CBD7D6E|nr:EF-hand domain-containing protein [Pseudomonas sp. A-RE-19]
MSKLTDAQLERVTADFKKYDTDQDGIVTVKEFTQTVEKFLTPEDLESLLKEVNPNDDNEISWEEFLDDYEKDL